MEDRRPGRLEGRRQEVEVSEAACQLLEEGVVSPKQNTSATQRGLTFRQRRLSLPGCRGMRPANSHDGQERIGRRLEGKDRCRGHRCGEGGEYEGRRPRWFVSTSRERLHFWTTTPFPFPHSRTLVHATDVFNNLFAIPNAAISFLHFETSPRPCPPLYKEVTNALPPPFSLPTSIHHVSNAQRPPSSSSYSTASTNLFHLLPPPASAIERCRSSLQIHLVQVISLNLVFFRRCKPRPWTIHLELESTLQALVIPPMPPPESLQASSPRPPNSDVSPYSDYRPATVAPGCTETHFPANSNPPDPIWPLHLCVGHASTPHFSFENFEFIWRPTQQVHPSSPPQAFPPPSSNCLPSFTFIIMSDSGTTRTTRQGQRPVVPKAQGKAAGESPFHLFLHTLSATHC